MRIRIVFDVLNKGGYVPFHHQFILAQLIKGVNLRGQNPKFLDFTNYNFSGLKGQTQVSRKGLHFYSNKVTLVFSSDSQEFTDYFVDNLFELEEFELGTLVLSPDYIEKEEPVLFDGTMKYVCISPIVLKKPSFHDPESKRFVNPEDDRFSDIIYDSTMSRMEHHYAYSKDQVDKFFQFQLVPDKEYLERLRLNHKKFARVYPVFDNDVKYEVRGYTFPFTLYADPEVQRFVFYNGLGAFCYKGFGMVDVANEDPSKRVVARKSRAFVTQ